VLVSRRFARIARRRDRAFRRPDSSASSALVFRRARRIARRFGARKSAPNRPRETRAIAHLGQRQRPRWIGLVPRAIGPASGRRRVRQRRLTCRYYRRRHAALIGPAMCNALIHLKKIFSDATRRRIIRMRGMGRSGMRSRRKRTRRARFQFEKTGTMACEGHAQRTLFRSIGDIAKRIFRAGKALPADSMLNAAQRTRASENERRKWLEAAAKIRTLTKFVGTSACSKQAIGASRDADRSVQNFFRATSRNRTQTVGIFPQLDAAARTKRKLPPASWTGARPRRTACRSACGTCARRYRPPALASTATGSMSAGAQKDTARMARLKLRPRCGR